ncbi:MAG: hypothetical protein R3D30_10220 [Hyphomicrobiales bacterium]
MASLLFSHGTPMLQMGDELGRTQGGNNNAFCQDNEISWVKWDGLTDRDASFLDFVRGVVSLRAQLPLLRSSKFLHGEPVAPRIKSIAWFKPDGEEKQAEHWEDPVAKCIGASFAGDKQILLLLFNADAEPIDFIFPFFGKRHLHWRLLCDSANGLIRPDPAPIATGKTTIRATVSCCSRGPADGCALRPFTALGRGLDRRRRAIQVVGAGARQGLGAHRKRRHHPDDQDR